MKNWKTTVGGILLAAGMSMQSSDNPTVKTIGFVCATIGGLMVGLTAKDFDKTGVK